MCVTQRTLTVQRSSLTSSLSRGTPTTSTACSTTRRIQCIRTLFWYSWPGLRLHVLHQTGRQYEHLRPDIWRSGWGSVAALHHLVCHIRGADLDLEECLDLPASGPGGMLLLNDTSRIFPEQTANHRCLWWQQQGFEEMPPARRISSSCPGQQDLGVQVCRNDWKWVTVLTFTILCMMIRTALTH